MYYKCKIQPTGIVTYINVDQFDAIVDYLQDSSAVLFIIGHLTQEELLAETNGSYVELKCFR